MTTALSFQYNPENEYEIGVDEAGRGPLFGRLYVAAVIVPTGGFQNPGIKDSKKIKSKSMLKIFSLGLKFLMMKSHSSFKVSHFFTFFSFGLSGSSLDFYYFMNV